MVIEATLFNPHAVSTGKWLHGLFLGGERNHYQRFSISSNGYWLHEYRLGSDTRVAGLRSEFSPDIDRSATGGNRLRLVVAGQEGRLYINNRLQDKLDLSVTEFDHARIFVTNERAGAATTFEGFSIWEGGSSVAGAPGQGDPTPLPSVTPHLPDVPIHGPVDGVITHDIQKPANFLSYSVVRRLTMT